MIYNEEYYKTGNYVNYSERKDKYKHLSKEIYQLLDNLCLINENSKILDYGCATGFLLEGFKELGLTNLYGMDISAFAVGECLKKELNVSFPNTAMNTDIFIALDVFEHMTDEDIFITLSIPMQIAIVRIPVALNPGEDFFLEISRKDTTHINCKTEKEWKKLFSESFKTILNLNLNSIYTSKGVTSLLLIK